jgi:hypothetical protein
MTGLWLRIGARNGGTGMGTQQPYWIAGGIALFVALAAGLADRRRHNRRNLDETGWMPWRGIQMAAIFVLIADLILAFKIG